MSEFQPIIRIGMYLLAGYLVNNGLPPDLAAMITTDPAILEMLSVALGALVAGMAPVWWRVAKWLGWAT